MNKLALMLGKKKI